MCGGGLSCGLSISLRSGGGLADSESHSGGLFLGEFAGLLLFGLLDILFFLGHEELNVAIAGAPIYSSHKFPLPLILPCALKDLLLPFGALFT